MNYRLTDRNSELMDPFFENFFNFPFGGEANSRMQQVMKTDVFDEGDHYEVKVDVPEIKKEDIKISLNDGYLTISASTSSNSNVKEHHKVVRRERYCGSYQRSFYVGNDVKEEDIKAKLDNGVLILNIAKKDINKEQSLKYINIE